MENSNPTNSSHNTPTYDLSEPLGQRFRHAREKKGLSIEQAAEKIFILKRHLQALEADDFEQLPQPTFARGFASSYGRFLGLDNDMVLQSFDKQYPSHLKQKHESMPNAPLQPMGTLQRDGRSGIKINLWMIIGIIVALGIMGYLLKTINNAHNETNQLPTETSIQGINNQEQATGADLNNAGSAIPTTDVASSLPATGSAITGVAVDNTNAQGSTVLNPTTLNIASAPSAGVAGQGELAFWVQKPATVTVTDANGQVLLTGEQARGAKNLVGKPPFKISIDNVSAVSLDYNKQPIKLSDYAQNNQANFTLK